MSRAFSELGSQALPTAKGINAFSDLSNKERRHNGDRVALW